MSTTAPPVPPPAADQCAICFDAVTTDGGERSTARLRCGHKFHLDCIGSAFNVRRRMQCPSCRFVEHGRWLLDARGVEEEDNLIAEMGYILGLENIDALSSIREGLLNTARRNISLDSLSFPGNLNLLPETQYPPVGNTIVADNEIFSTSPTARVVRQILTVAPGQRSSADPLILLQRTAVGPRASAGALSLGLGHNIPTHRRTLDRFHAQPYDSNFPSESEPSTLFSSSLNRTTAVGPRASAGAPSLGLGRSIPTHQRARARYQAQPYNRNFPSNSEPGTLHRRNSRRVVNSAPPPPPPSSPLSYDHISGYSLVPELIGSILGPSGQAQAYEAMLPAEFYSLH